jgi:hypothetical protein
LATLTSRNGPNGYELPIPTKIATDTQTFMFKNEWEVEAVSPELANGYKVGDIILSTDFDKVAPK